MARLFFLIYLGLSGSVGTGNIDHISAKNDLLSVPFPQSIDSKRAIDVSNSTVEWKGTKLRGTGSHTGTVDFQEGYFLFEEERLVGGEFVVDMTSIYNTDIPLSDPIPRRNITTHLNSDFDTRAFPTSTFTITKVEYKGNSYVIQGAMTIKGIEKMISLDAVENPPGVYYTEFSIDRYDWRIGEDNSWLEQKLVDRDIFLKITIQLKK